MPLRVTLQIWRARFGHWLIGNKFMPMCIRPGDWITHRAWSYGPVQVVDLNLALRAVVIRLGPNGGIVVMPMDPKSRFADAPEVARK